MTNNVQRTFTDGSYKNADTVISGLSTYGEIGADILPAERKKLLDAIDYLSRLEDGWNGYNALCSTELSITRSKEFINKLWGKIYPDTVSPDGEGGVKFKWKNQDLVLIITVDSNALYLSLSFPNQKNKADIFLDNIPFEGEIIPPEIADKIPTRQKQK